MNIKRSHLHDERRQSPNVSGCDRLGRQHGRDETGRSCRITYIPTDIQKERNDGLGILCQDGTQHGPGSLSGPVPRENNTRAERHRAFEASRMGHGPMQPGERTTQQNLGPQN